MMTKCLSDYTTEELKAEIKRRNAEMREKRKAEMLKKATCRNCVHFKPRFASRVYDGGNCEIKQAYPNTKQEYLKHYRKTVQAHGTCDDFKRKESDESR